MLSKSSFDATDSISSKISNTVIVNQNDYSSTNITGNKDTIYTTIGSSLLEKKLQDSEYDNIEYIESIELDFDLNTIQTWDQNSINQSEKSLENEDDYTPISSQVFNNATPTYNYKKCACLICLCDDPIFIRNRTSKIVSESDISWNRSCPSYDLTRQFYENNEK